MFCSKLYPDFLSTNTEITRLKSTLPHFFIESWIYSSALSTVDHCEGWAKEQKQEGATLVAFNASKADLLELARSQVINFKCIFDRLSAEYL